MYMESTTTTSTPDEAATLEASCTVRLAKSGTMISLPCWVTSERKRFAAKTKSSTASAASSRFLTIQFEKNPFMFIFS